MAVRWLGAVEGYYGPPLAHEDRIDLVRWLGSHGFNAYAYAPKDDPYHRERWRDPYPDERQAQFRELVAAGRDAGVDVALVVSPGLDWRPGEDEPALIAKLSSFVEHGARVLGIAFDDVPPGGADLGAAHAAAIQAGVAALPDDIRWVVCPTDYATAHATLYLKAFVAGLPDHVDVMWTGPSIVSPKVTGADARSLAAEVGRPLLFAENYPVNDGAMAGVLHLGPYRGRAPDLPDATRGVFFNFMALARASRPALACGARFWLDPTIDAEAAWEQTLREFPGLEPLARASRTWANDPAEDPALVAMVDQAIDGDPRALNAYLDAGCRDGLDPALAAELAPWLDQWEAERWAMWFAILLMALPVEWRASGSFVVAEAWARARFSRLQLFGVRWVHYPLTTRDGDVLVPRDDAVMTGENMTDRLCRIALERASAR